jgi:hypothetical protein
MKVRVSVTVMLDESECFEADAYGKKDRFLVECLSITDQHELRSEIYASGTRLTKKGTLYKGGQQKRAWAFLPVKDLPPILRAGLVDAGVLEHPST